MPEAARILPADAKTGGCMRRSIVVLTAMLSLVCVDASAAEDARDFTGVWQAFVSVPAIGRTAPAGTLTNEGEVKVADFAARYPNMVEPDAYCLPPGMPATMTAIDGNPIDITQTPTRLTLLAPAGQYRRIYLDERDYPESQPPSRLGYSIAHWDANTLVIETRLLSEQLTGRFPRTEATVVVERVSKLKGDQVTAPVNPAITTPSVDDDVLAFNITVTDQTLYVKPQTFTVYYQHVSDDELREHDCTSALWKQALDAANP